MSGLIYVPPAQALKMMREEREKLKVWRVTYLDLDDMVLLTEDVEAFAVGFAILKIEQSWEPEVDEPGARPKRAAVVQNVRFVSYAA